MRCGWLTEMDGSFRVLIADSCLLACCVCLCAMLWDEMEYVYTTSHFTILSPSRDNKATNEKILENIKLIRKKLVLRICIRRSHWCSFHSCTLAVGLWVRVRVLWPSLYLCPVCGCMYLPLGKWWATSR